MRNWVVDVISLLAGGGYSGSVVKVEKKKKKPIVRRMEI